MTACSGRYRAVLSGQRAGGNWIRRGGRSGNWFKSSNDLHSDLHAGSGVIRVAVYITLALMTLDRVREHLAGSHDLSTVQISTVDHTRGETTESFFVLGSKKEFGDIYEFSATALQALATQREESLQELEFDEWASEPWMHALDPTLNPGSALCFPPASVLGFEPPQNLQRRFHVAPNWSPVEEGYICEGSHEYVLLYWYTTG